MDNNKDLFKIPDNAKKVDINLSTKGIILLAKPQNTTHFAHCWILLIHSLSPITLFNKNFAYVETHLSAFKLGASVTITPHKWCVLNHYDFYLPTEEQKKYVFETLRNKGYKYIPILNKLIEYNGPSNNKTRR